MFTPKFNYTKLTRETVDGKRHYCTPDGRKLPSVTTILDKTKPEEKVKALQEWRDRVGHQKAQQITTEAASRGTSMHSHLENYLKNGEHKRIGTNLVHDQGYKMADIIINNALVNIDEVWGMEVPVYFPGLYAGSTDLACVFKGKPSICDHKQSNRLKKKEYIEDYLLQLVAYALAHNEVHGTDIKEGHIFMCTKDLQYQQFDLTPNMFDEYLEKWLTRVEQFYKITG